MIDMAAGPACSPTWTFMWMLPLPLITCKDACVRKNISVLDGFCVSVALHVRPTRRVKGPTETHWMLKGSAAERALGNARVKGSQRLQRWLIVFLRVFLLLKMQNFLKLPLESWEYSREINKLGFYGDGETLYHCHHKKWNLLWMFFLPLLNYH